MNRRFFYVLILFIFSTSLVSKAAQYSINVADFSELTVENGVNVEYITKPDSAGWVVFETQPELASKVLLSNTKSNLHIQIDVDELVEYKLPTVKVYSTSLKRVTNCGDSTVRVNLAEEVETFNARVIGNGSIYVRGIHAETTDAKITAGRGIIELQGKTENAKFAITGTGIIDALELSAQDVRTTTLGPSRIFCAPTRKLLATGMSGRVYYSTNPAELIRRGMGVKALPLEVYKEE